MNSLLFKSLSLLIISSILLGCKQNKTELPFEDFSASPMEIYHAEGFTVDYTQDYKIISIKNPWPKAKQTYKYVLISKENAAKTTFMANEYDGIILSPVEKLVVTSTTHIPALELLDKLDILKGFPGTDYISSEEARQLISRDSIRELGKNEGINTEVLLEIKPDVVVGFGVDGINKTFETIKRSGIPVIYNGDWVENSPLAKAEWIKFFGALLDQEKVADSIFNSIEQNYQSVKTQANHAKSKPSVLSGALYKDVWYVPGGNSPEASLMRDANLDYLWSDTEDNGSLSLSFETVFEKAKEAELWISPSSYGSYEAMNSASELYSEFNAFQKKKVYSFVNTKGETGGLLYYELGSSRPDLVLKDLVMIGHPELNLDHQLTFFKPLK